MVFAKIYVTGTCARVTELKKLTSGLAGGKILVDYDDHIWAGLNKTVVFRGIVEKDVLTGETAVEIPWEVLGKPCKRLWVGFYGTDSDKNMIIPTVYADLGPVLPGADPSGDESTDPSLPVWAQLQNQIDDLRESGSPGGGGGPGENGGYYTPSVKQPDSDTLQFDFTPSKAGMPAIDPVQVDLPAGPQGPQGDDYKLTDEDKKEIAEMAAELVVVPDSGGNVELDTTLTQSGKAADAKAVGDKIAEITGISLIEPAGDDIPKIFFGGALQQTKDEAVVPFRYISKTDDFSGYAEIKAQGNSSMSYPKKNQTVKMFKDAECTEKMKVDFKGWGKQNKHVYKANWIDLTHARNVVSARLWGDVVKSRANYEELPELLRTSPNQGAVNGFPVKVYAAGVYQGRYTLNIPKDAWMANMDKDLDTHCILCGENYVSGCFRAAANINESDWTDEIHDTVPASIKTRWNQVISFVMNSTDEEFRANLNQYFYVDSLIDYYLFGLASCGLDAFGKNQLYMTYDGQKWIATMYDMDSTWGLWWNGSSFVATDYDRSEYQDFKDGEGNLLYIRLENLFYEELQARWSELRGGALSIENIINRFERFTDIAPAELVNEDYASTTGGGKFTGIPSKTTSTIQQIRSYAVARHAWCDTYVSALAGGGEVDPDEPDAPEVIPCTGITLDKTELTFDGEGTQTITATVTPSDTTDTVIWVSSAPAVASITVEGNVCTVQSVRNGNATITVTCGEQSTTCAVSVSGIVEIIDYTLNPLASVSWENGKYDHATGALKESTTDYRTNKFELQNCVYNLQFGSDASWPGLYIWNENDEYVGSVTLSGQIGMFAAKPGWKYAVSIYNNPDAVSLMPVDQSAGAGDLSISIDSGSVTWSDTPNGQGAEFVASEALAAAGFSNLTAQINKCSHLLFFGNAGIGTNFVGTGIEPVMWFNNWAGTWYLLALDIAAADVPALVGTMTIN